MSYPSFWMFWSKAAPHVTKGWHGLILFTPQQTRPTVENCPFETGMLSPNGAWVTGPETSWRSQTITVGNVSLFYWKPPDEFPKGFFSSKFTSSIPSCPILSHPVPSCPILSAQWCRPKFLAIHNSNLPGHAGWIPAQLKRRAATAQDDHAWYELMNGSLGLLGDLELGLLKVSLQAEWSLMFLGVQTLNDMSSFVVLDGLNGLTTTN